MPSARTLVLLGDSILDNASYTRPAPDTAHHLRTHLGAGWRVELLARDGACISDVRFQLFVVLRRRPTTSKAGLAALLARVVPVSRIESESPVRTG